MLNAQFSRINWGSSGLVCCYGDLLRKEGGGAIEIHSSLEVFLIEMYSMLMNKF